MTKVEIAAFKRENLEGHVFGTRTVIGPCRLLVSKRISKATGKEYEARRAYWLVRCECGHESVVSGSTLIFGLSKTCSKCRAKKAPGVAARNRVYQDYKNKAKNRNLVWGILFSDFCDITQRKCFYCGRAPHNKAGAPRCNGQYVYSGIDRVDDSVGYILSNITSCCKDCNFAKRNMTADRFIELARLITENQKMTPVTSP